MQINTIKVGDYVIVQRQGYTKLHKMKDRGTVILGKDVIELDNTIGHKYYTTFRMVLKTDSKRCYTLEKVAGLTTTNQLNIEQSGNDNRNIVDDGNSQKLTKMEIEELRDQGKSSSDVVEQLIANSKTFNTKTEYSQEKYLKKKEKKYFEYIQIRKPSVRLLAQMYYRLDPSKTLGIRIDDLSQILTFVNVQDDRNILLYDSGTSGLVTAAIMNAIGANTTGHLIHAHPGNECQKGALLAMQFPKEQLNRCIQVNLYSVLRCYYQTLEDQVDQEAAELLNNGDSSSCEPSPSKKPKFCHDEDVNAAGSSSALKKPSWQIDNERACKILEEKVHGVIIVAKEDPLNIVQELVPFLKPGQSLVVFHLVKELLQDLYFHLKSGTDFIAVRLSNNFMRNYQILPERTHPEVTMNFGGYILSAVKVDC